MSDSKQAVKAYMQSMINTDDSRKCYVCGAKDKVLFKDSQDGELKYICVDDRNSKMLGTLPLENANDYLIKWRLRDADGKTWIETFTCCDMADFEVIYGNNIHQILWLTIRMRGQAMF